MEVPDLDREDHTARSMVEGYSAQVTFLLFAIRQQVLSVAAVVARGSGAW